MDQNTLFMKILLLGAGGQLGQELKRTLPHVIALTRHDLDITNILAVQTTLNQIQPQVIVNAAAYTAVDRAEQEKDLAFHVNAQAVKIIAQEAMRHHIKVIHYSTDYVFNGQKKTPYTETDRPDPINIYGASKRAGEQYLKESGCDFWTFRTSWVVGHYGHNFITTILRLAQNKKSLSVVNDQYGAPTSTSLISLVTQNLIKSFSKSPWPQGIYHLTPQGTTTWYALAKHIISLAQNTSFPLGLTPDALRPIPTHQYTTSAPRPRQSCLNTSKLEKILSFTLPHWKDDFSTVTTNLIEAMLP